MNEKTLTVSFDVDAGKIYIVLDDKIAYCYHTLETERLALRFEKVVDKAVKQFHYVYSLQ